MALLKRKRVGLNDAMSVVTRFVNACNRHDADGVAACLHPDFDSIQPMYPSRNFRGADQVRRNWQAIFDAEPGFRLTVLRSAATDDTVWLELHGAGRDAEVAGIFIMGVTGERIRWARIYSALVEPVVPGVGEPSDPAASLQEVRSSPGGGEVVQEDLIAPVVDIDRSTRRRRRRRSESAAAEATTAVEEQAPETPEAVSETPEAESDAPEAEADAPEAVSEAPTAESEAPEAVPETDAEPDVEVVEAAAVEVAGDEAVVVVEAEQAVDRPLEGGPDTEAVAVIVWDEEPAPEDAVEPEAEPTPSTEAAKDEGEQPADRGATESSKRRFGKRR